MTEPCAITLPASDAAGRADLAREARVIRSRLALGR